MLEVPFDTNIARDIMTEKYGVATRLMYQLFIALNKKENSNLTGVAIETMRPAAPVKLEGVERLIYKEVITFINLPGLTIKTCIITFYSQCFSPTVFFVVFQTTFCLFTTRKKCL